MVIAMMLRMLSLTNKNDNEDDDGDHDGNVNSHYMHNMMVAGRLYNC